jgi:hypothetical protein
MDTPQQPAPILKQARIPNFFGGRSARGFVKGRSHEKSSLAIVHKFNQLAAIRGNCLRHPCPTGGQVIDPIDLAENVGFFSPQAVAEAQDEITIGTRELVDVALETIQEVDEAGVDAIAACCLVQDGVSISLGDFWVHCNSMFDRRGARQGCLVYGVAA